MWLADFIPNTTIFTVGIHVTNLNYLKNGFFYFMELSDGNIEESNKIFVRLDKIAAISDNNDKHFTNLLDLKAK